MLIEESGLKGNYLLLCGIWWFECRGFHRDMGVNNCLLRAEKFTQELAIWMEKKKNMSVSYYDRQLTDMLVAGRGWRLIWVHWQERSRCSEK